MGFVSVPEKTLEHWSSQYLNYRYRSKASLWWPAYGEDINVVWLPRRPGKAVQIELKTTTVTRPNLHDVRINLRQLWEYLQLPLSRQPFYAFPRPSWKGLLTEAAAYHGIIAAELAYQRSGRTWWFAEWMVVMPAADVAAVLGPKFDLRVQPDPKATARLVRYDMSVPHPLRRETWATPLPVHSRPLKWRRFWDELQHCGRPGWPQLVRLPSGILPPGGRFSATTVLEMLGEVRGPGQYGANDLIDLVPDSDGGFRRSPTEELGRTLTIDAEPTGAEEHRQLVYLDASEMSPQV
jgi:hypothetical protein